MKIGDLIKERQTGTFQVGDWVRSKKSGYYGLILNIHGGDMAEVLWQGLTCNISWEFLHDMVLGVEGELLSWRAC